MDEVLNRNTGMSLKVFHIAFIGLSMVLTVLFGVWAVQQGEAYLFVGIAAFLASAGLIVYGYRFIKKWKSIQYILAGLILSLSSTDLSACSSCFVVGSNDTETKALMWSMFTLFCFVAFILAGIAVFIVYLWNRSRLYSQEVT